MRSDFRIFFTADPQRPTANRLSDAFLDRCTVIECQSFDKLYKKRCQAADAKSEIENTYLEAVKGLGVVHDVFQRSELLAQSLVELHAAALREEPNTRLYVAQHVCGAPLTARTLRRALTSMEAFSGPEAALELVFGDWVKFAVSVSQQFLLHPLSVFCAFKPLMQTLEQQGTSLGYFCGLERPFLRQSALGQSRAQARSQSEFVRQRLGIP